MPLQVESTNAGVRVHAVPRAHAPETGIQGLEDVYVAYAGEKAPWAVRYAVDLNPDVRAGLVVAPGRFYETGACKGHTRIQFFALETFNDTRARFESVFRPEYVASGTGNESFLRWWLLTEMLRRLNMNPKAWIVCIDHDLFPIAPLRTRIEALRSRIAHPQGGFFLKNAFLATTSRALVAYCHYHRLLWTNFEARRVCWIARNARTVHEPLKIQRRRWSACGERNATQWGRLLSESDVAAAFVVHGRRRGWPKWTLAARGVECIDVKRKDKIQRLVNATPTLSEQPHTTPVCYIHFHGPSEPFMESWLRSQVEWMPTKPQRQSIHETSTIAQRLLNDRSTIPLKRLLKPVHDPRPRVD